MGIGIFIGGLNGSGKSTVGKALAKKLHFQFIDSEDLYFTKSNGSYIYDKPRTKKEVEKLLLDAVKTNENFVFASVKGDYGEAIYPFFQYAVLIDVEKEIRLQRVFNRSYQKFGDRMLLGGDLYEKEKKFLDFVKNRDENAPEEWIQCLNCPIIRIDGTKPVEENVKFIIEQIQQSKKTS